MDWLLEQIKTCCNLCDVVEILIRQKRRELLPTILELLYQEAQVMIDENCIIGVTDDEKALELDKKLPV